MPAPVAAAVTPAQMMGGGEHHQPMLKVKIPRQHLLRWMRLRPMKGHHARAAQAGPVGPVRRHLRQQRLGNFHPGAPAGAFIGGGGAELAVIGLAAQWALGGLNQVLGILAPHGTARLSGRNRPRCSLGRRGSSEPGTGFSRSTWPSARVTFATRLCRNWAFG